MAEKEKYIKLLLGYNPEEKEDFKENIKYYRDLKNVIDTAFDEGKIEGKIESLINVLQYGKLSIEEIAHIFNVSIEYVLQIKKKNNL